MTTSVVSIYSLTVTGQHALEVEEVAKERGGVMLATLVLYCLISTRVEACNKRDKAVVFYFRVAVTGAISVARPICEKWKDWLRSYDIWYIMLIAKTLYCLVFKCKCKCECLWSDIPLSLADFTILHPWYWNSLLKIQSQGWLVVWRMKMNFKSNTHRHDFLGMVHLWWAAQT